MKKILFLAIVSIAFASCQKLEHMNPFCKKQKEKACAIVSTEQVPQAVTKSYSDLYSGATAETWFNKDGKGYSVMCTYNGEQTLINFDNDGNFIKAKMHNKKEGHKKEQGGCMKERKDKHDDDKGCVIKLAENQTSAE